MRLRSTSMKAVGDEVDSDESGMNADPEMALDVPFRLRAGDGLGRAFSTPGRRRPWACLFRLLAEVGRNQLDDDARPSGFAGWRREAHRRCRDRKYEKENQKKHLLISFNQSSC